MSSDRAIASDITASLESAGLSVWWDRHIRAGSDFSAEIEREIEAARVVIVLWSKTSLDSPWVRDEAAYARDRKKLIPVRLDASEPPMGFRQVQTLSLDVSNRTERARILVELASAVSGILTRAPAAPPHSPAPIRARRRWPIALAAGASVAIASWLIVGNLTVDPPPSRDNPIVPAAPAKSIAVLPFTDMSETKDQEFLADGMAEEIIHLLAKAPDLLVTARTSSFHFKGTNTKVPDIARELGVAHVLEGSIRRSGDLLRVTAQLIRADNGYHLWSETYDRELSNIFQTQGDIAGAVAQALRIKLMGGELIREKGGTQNLDAYQLYLQAKSATYQVSHQSLEAATRYLGEALELDPSYGLAWAWLSLAEISIGDNTVTIAARPVYERAKQHAQHALELSPEIPEAHAALSQLHRVLDWDWAASDAEGRRAIALDPTNPDVLQITAFNSLVLGRFDDAERQLRAALARDPLNTYVIWTLGLTLFTVNRLSESEALFRSLFRIAPDYTETRHVLARVLVAQGRGEEALAVMQQEQDKGWKLFVLPIVLEAAGRKAEADEALKAQVAAWRELGGCAVARTYAYRREYDEALDWLERCAEQRDIGIFWLIGEPLFRGMSDHPRFKALVRKLNLPDS